MLPFIYIYIVKPYHRDIGILYWTGIKIVQTRVKFFSRICIGKTFDYKYRVYRLLLKIAEMKTYLLNNSGLQAFLSRMN